jgi:hypothetical protein
VRQNGVMQKQSVHGLGESSTSNEEKTMRIIIAGSRAFKDYKLLVQEVDKFIEENGFRNVTIVSGTATGADQLGEYYAAKKNLPCQKFPAQWDKYGKSAGYKRNVEMADYAGACIIFRVAMSKGSTHMANIAQEKNLILKVIELEENHEV